MDNLYSIILGIIQGLTEFWPISSSGHLVIAHDVLQFDFVDNLSFDAALHLGTLLALVVFFWRDIIRYIVAWVKSFANWNLQNDLSQRMAWFIFVGSIPAGVVGYFIDQWAETVFRNLWLVALLLIGVGLLFIVFERIFQKTKELAQMGWLTAIIIGLAQVLALVPGVSRSGITILAGLSQGLKRSVAARFSFLLSLPVVFGAGLKKMFELGSTGLEGSEWFVIIIGLLTAAVVGYMAIRFLLRYLENHSLNIFAYYRFLLGVVVIIYLLVNQF